MSFGRENENERGGKKRGVIWAKKKKKRIRFRILFYSKVFRFLSEEHVGWKDMGMGYWESGLDIGYMILL